MVLNKSVGSLIEQYKNFLAVGIIYFAALGVYFSFPETFSGTDEWVYYHQAKALADKGFFDGFEMLAQTYIINPMLHDAPHPLRLAAISGAGLAVYIHDSSLSIAMVCLINFVLLLTGTYWFIKRELNTQLALLVILLLSVSPLEIGVAKRALMDMPSLTALVFSCYAFWLMVKYGDWKYRIAFVLVMTWGILIKEANGTAMLPFFGLCSLYLWWKKEIPLSFLAISVLMIAPVLLTLALYEIVIGHTLWIPIFQIYFESASHSPYSAQWGQGPWSRTIIDFTLLSPYVVILALGYAGYILFTRNADRFTIFILFLGVYLLIYFHFLPKNIRYVILFDFPLRFLTASAILMLYKLYSGKKQAILLSILLVFLLAADIKSFYFHFIEQNIYDPTSYILLVVNKMIPG